MESAGFDLGDVPVDESGRPDLSVLAGDASTDLEFRQALTLCAGPLTQFLGPGSSPGLRVMVQALLERYAQCMRSSGVE